MVKKIYPNKSLAQNWLTAKIKPATLRIRNRKRNRRMENGTETRACVNLEKLISYIETNYRSNLVPIDYEILKEISEKYKSEEILRAIQYCKKQNSNSLKYLQDALSKKYYGDFQIVPDWMNKTIEIEKLSKSDIDFVKEFYYQFCNSKEEAEKRIKEMELT